MPVAKKRPALAIPAEEESTGTPLTKEERKDVRERRPPRAVVVFETVRTEGEEELKRPAFSLAASGLAAGLAMGFSFLGIALISSMLPDTPSRPLFESMGYTLGFLFVILGRQQLFTENTLTVILPLLDAPKKLPTLLKVLRLWGIVLLANLVGVFLFSTVVAHTPVFPADVQAQFDRIGHLAIAAPPGTILLRGIFAGWLLAMMVWLLPAADTARPWIILIVTYLVGLGGFSHIIAGSAEVFYLVSTGQLPFTSYLTNFLLPVFCGNVIGGVSLVSLLNYGQIVAEKS
jgi:formate/nitrite transporter FocA (FNT family)